MSEEEKRKPPVYKTDLPNTQVLWRRIHELEEELEEAKREIDKLQAGVMEEGEE